MKELLEGRRLGFAPRSHLAFVAIGLGFAATLIDLMAWFGWGARDTNGFVIANAWLTVLTAVVALLATIAALVESSDAPEDDRSLARLDLLAAFVTFVLYAASAGLRTTVTPALVSACIFSSAVPCPPALFCEVNITAGLTVKPGLYFVRLSEGSRESVKRVRIFP